MVISGLLDFISSSFLDLRFFEKLNPGHSQVSVARLDCEHGEG